MRCASGGAAHADGTTPAGCGQRRLGSMSSLARWPEQPAYEQLRPIVRFGQVVAERVRATATPERTLFQRVARFEAEGMVSLVPPPKVAQHRRLPAPIRRAIRDLKTEPPAFHTREIASICAVCFGRRPSPHTVKRILAEEPPAPHASRRFPPYGEIADPAEVRLASIRLHSEGWAVKSIAAYLAGSRPPVYRTLRRWIAEGVVGLGDKASAPRQPATKVTLRVIAMVKEWRARAGWSLGRPLAHRPVAHRQAPRRAARAVARGLQPQASANSR